MIRSISFVVASARVLFVDDLMRSGLSCEL